MQTKRLAGMVGLLAVVVLGVIGIDRLSKDAKARALDSESRVAAHEPPARSSTIHYQVDPGAPPKDPAAPQLPQLPPLPDSSVPPLPPLPPLTDDKQPPLLSTGELEKQLKQSLDNLNRALLPKLSDAEESSQPPEPAKKPADEKNLPALPSIPPPPATPSVVPAVGAKDTGLPPPPNLDTPPAEDRPTKNQAPVVPPPVNIEPPAPVNHAPPVDTPKSLNPMPATPLPGLPPPPNTDSGSVRSATVIIAPNGDFQKRLTDLEIKYLKDSVAELDGRIKQMPGNDPERRKLEMDQQRLSDRLGRLMKAAELTKTGLIENASGKSVGADSPWTMHLETMDGKTILQAMVHKKAKFKIICDRLDLQTPRGTVLAVGDVQIMGEGFQGKCDRLSIPLHDDRLILEGSAQVGIRTQSMAIIEGTKESLPPLGEPRRLEDQAVTAAPVLHLKGDHLDLRWSDLQPTTPASTRAEDGPATKIRATPGHMVKVAFNSSRNEQWSEWGTLRRTMIVKDGRPVYLIEDAQGQPLAYVHTPAGMSMTEYVGKRVSVFGFAVRDASPSRTPAFTASHVAWE